MSKPLPTEEATPTRGAMTFSPTTGVRTTQATFVLVLISAFTLGGVMMSIKYDIANQAKETSSIRSDVDELKRAVFYDSRVTGNPKTNPKVSTP